MGRSPHFQIRGTLGRPGRAESTCSVSLPQQERVWSALTYKMPDEGSGLAGKLSTHLGLLRLDTLVLVIRDSRGHHHLVRDSRRAARSGGAQPHLQGP